MEELDKNIILELKDGSFSAFEQIYKTYYPKAKFYANQFLYDIHESGNLAQDVFLLLWEQRDRLDENKNILAFILTVTRNKCLDVLKRKIHEQRYLNVKNSIIINYTLLKDVSSQLLIAGELSDKIKETMDVLPEKVKEAFYLSRFKYLKYDDIAKIQQVSRKTVEYRIAQALRVFRVTLKDYTY